MSFKKIMFALLAILLLASSVSATLTFDRDTYHVQRGDTLKIDFTYNGITGSNYKVFVQMYVKNDEQGYFVTKQVSKMFNAVDNKKVRLKMEVNPETPPQEEYEFVIKETVINELGNVVNRGEYNILVKVDDFDEVDVKLLKDTFCYGEAPYETYLIYNNDTTEEYMMETKVKSEDLWPSVKTKLVEVPSDEETVRVYLKLNKNAPVGDYVLTIDTTLYRENNTNIYNKPINFQKDLTVHIVDCLKTNVNFNLLTNSVDLKPNVQGMLYTDFVNNTEEDMPVQFVVESDDPSLVLTLEKNSKIVKGNESFRNVVYVMPTEHTVAGIKTVTIKAITPYNVLTKTAYVNVEKANLSISYNIAKVKVGLKAVEDISITNNSNQVLNLILTTESVNDTVYLERNNITINPNETVVVKANIVPKTAGYKSFKLKIEGDLTLEKEIYYEVSGKTAAPVFAVNYSKRVEASNEASNYVSVILSNPYNFNIELTISLENADLFKAVPQTVELRPKETKAVNVPFYTTDVSAGKYATNLVVESELGTTKLPVRITVEPDYSNLNPLELVDLPSELAFVKGKDITYNLKVKNPNNLTINDAVLTVKKDGEVLAMKSFAINANETKEIEFNLNVDEEDDFIAEISVVAGESTNNYTVTFVKDDSLMNTGLFGLGLGSTLGLVLGIIIVILIIVLLVLNNRENNEDEIQEIDEDEDMVNKSI